MIPRAYDFDDLHAALVGRVKEITLAIDPFSVLTLRSTGGSRFTQLIANGQQLVTVHAFPSRPEAKCTVTGYGEFIYRFDEDQPAMLAHFEQWLTEALRTVC